MKQTSMQFHAKRQEIINFVRNVVNENDIRAFGIILFPEYKAEEIINFDNDQINNYYFIVLCQDEIRLESENDYSEYLKQMKGDLIISLGRDDETELKESSMGVISKKEINILWQKIIRQFGRKLIRGAFVVSPNGKKGYYPKHGYTVGAKEAYKNGVMIKPVAGWNYYILEQMAD